MKKRRTELDRAIENLNAEIATLVLARQRLIEQKQHQNAPKAKGDAVDATTLKDGP